MNIFERAAKFLQVNEADPKADPVVRATRELAVEETVSSTIRKESSDAQRH